MVPGVYGRDMTQVIRYDGRGKRLDLDDATAVRLRVEHNGQPMQIIDAVVYAHDARDVDELDERVWRRAATQAVPLVLEAFAAGSIPTSLPHHAFDVAVGYVSAGELELVSATPMERGEAIS
jgi:hypothetical protein